ncbi:MAG: hypothetical protein KatS3mg060_2903 [Dehalococcoidia bacterium]|nr:MAG: hypothetical protein KatS3mg060_2903 [Dehalococcoidia bacterium]
MIEHLANLSGLLLLSLVSLVLAIFGTHVLGSWKVSSR